MDGEGGGHGRFLAGAGKLTNSQMQVADSDPRAAGEEISRRLPPRRARGSRSRPETPATSLRPPGVPSVVFLARPAGFARRALGPNPNA